MWYSARLLYESIAVDSRQDHEPFFEEKLIVFRCDESEDLMTRLTASLREDERAFENAAGYRIRWAFREVLEVQEVDDETIDDGTEVFFRYWHNPGPKEFESMRQTHGDKWWVEGN